MRWIEAQFRQAEVERNASRQAKWAEQLSRQALKFSQFPATIIDY